MIVTLIAHLLTYTRLSTKVGAIIARVGAVAFYAAIGYGFYCWAYDQGRDDERAKWEAAAEILEDADAAADAEAIDVAHDTKESINATNQRAADAAAQSDDPLRSGLDSLRAESSRKGD